MLWHLYYFTVSVCLYVRACICVPYAIYRFIFFFFLYSFRFSDSFFHFVSFRFVSFRFVSFRFRFIFIISFFFFEYLINTLRQ